MINSDEKGLDRSLGPLMLWGLGVGYVISGMYFGWNLGLDKGGTLGLGIATIFVIIMYVTFTLSYTELACAIPKAGGAFDYATEAFGPKWGLLGGMAQIIEFVFAPPAIAAAIGAYLVHWFPNASPLVFALSAYLLFTGLNIWGVKIAASFELVITILAVVELLIFAGVTLPHFEVKNITANALPHGVGGIFAAIPFAIWFFLAIEGIANVAEETIEPQKNVVIGFSFAIATLVILCLLTFFSSIGVGGWESIVYDSAGSTSDSPLPLALGQIFAKNHPMFHLLLSIGFLGLVASFHGIILAGGRASYEFGKYGLAPKFLGDINPKFKTPANALIANMFIGILALLTGKTGDIITIACFGALTLYIISILSLFKLRKSKPQLDRPFKVPCYPAIPAISLIISIVCIVAMAYYNQKLAIIFIAILVSSQLLYLATKRKDSLSL